MTYHVNISRILYKNNVPDIQIFENNIPIYLTYLQWCQLESLQVLFYEAKVPNSDGYITV